MKNVNSFFVFFLLYLTFIKIPEKNKKTKKQKKQKNKKNKKTKKTKKTKKQKTNKYKKHKKQKQKMEEQSMEIVATTPSKYVSTISFSLIYAGIFCSIVYYCSSRGENAYYSLVACDSAVFLGMCILSINIFMVAMYTEEDNASSSSSSSFYMFISIFLTSLIMLAFLGSLGMELFLLLKYKALITDGNISDGFWKFSTLSLILTTLIILIFSFVFKENNVRLSNLTLSGLSIFSFFKVVVTGFVNEILFYFRSDGFRTYLLQ